MHDEWRMAWVSVPKVTETKEVEEVVVPDEAIVDFFMGNENGSYTNHLHFQVALGQIIFRQDNLTLPAYYEKEEKLPFVIVGMNGGKAIIKATITEQGKENTETSDYTIRTAWDEKIGCYHAFIRDKVLDPEADHGIPGNYLAYTINIEARRPDSPTVIRGTLPLNRYYMGLIMRMNDNVNCFLEEYDPARHDYELKVRREDGKDYAPAQQKCFLQLYTYDEEKHKLQIVDPMPKSVTWTVRDLKAEKVMRDLIGNEAMRQGLDIALATAGLGSIGTLVSQAHSQVFQQEEQNLMEELSYLNQKMGEERMRQFQQQANSMGLQFKAEQETIGEGRIYYMLRCAKGVLRAPNRFDVEMELTAEHKDKTYTFNSLAQAVSDAVYKVA